MTETNKTSQQSETFTALNGLRFLAAMGVVVFHYAPKTEGFTKIPNMLKALINNGPAAVSFFFILSGFVLGHRYLRRGITNGVEVGPFFRARFARLYPAYITGFLLFAPVALEKYFRHPHVDGGGAQTFVLGAALSLFMVQAWTPYAQSWNGPSWSLSVEAFMYLVFPLVGLSLVSLKKKHMVATLFVLWLLPVSLACAYVRGVIPVQVWHRYISNAPLLWTPLFFIGICGSRFLSSWNSVSARRAAAMSTVTFVSIIILAGFWPAAWSEVFVTGGIAPLFLAIIVFFTRRLGWIAKILGGRIFNELGKVSYVIYIIQAPLWHYWQGFVRLLTRTPLNSVVGNWEFYLYIPILIITSCLVPLFIETPFRNWFLKATKLRGPVHRECLGAQIDQPVGLGAA